jgi:CNT family concentrative nucleoside transporter
MNFTKEKSILISHYAICGFSNFGSIAIQMATLSSLAPHKSKVFAKIALKSMIAGNIGNFFFIPIFNFETEVSNQFLYLKLVL